MDVRRRKIEVHRLTISGLEDETPYGEFLHSLRWAAPSVKDIVLEGSAKSHALYSADVKGNLLHMLFMTYTKGERPNILDTQQFTVSPSPLGPTETGVEWTHLIGGYVDGRYLLLIEKRQAGIWPGSIEEYLNWLFSKATEDQSFRIGQDVRQWRVVFSIEAEAGESFIKRLKALDRVTSVRVRIVRPNPGWKDLEAVLGTVADESDAHKAELVAKARPRSSLEKGRGLVKYIHDLFGERKLDFAEVEGWRKGEKERFNSQRLGRAQLAELPVDEGGQVLHSEAWDKMAEMHNKLD